MAQFGRCPLAQHVSDRDLADERIDEPGWRHGARGTLETI
jgi:hypothetical protein